MFVLFCCIVNVLFEQIYYFILFFCKKRSSSLIDSLNSIAVATRICPIKKPIFFFLNQASLSLLLSFSLSSCQLQELNQSQAYKAYLYLFPKEKKGKKKRVLHTHTQKKKSFFSPTFGNQFYNNMLASSVKNSSKLFNTRASLGLYRHRAAFACAGIHTTHKSKSALASP